LRVSGGSGEVGRWVGGELGGLMGGERAKKSKKS